jgi:DnaJ-class molecular chaperone
MRQPDYYELLGVEAAARELEIKSAYRRLALRHHPDRNGGDRLAEERFKAISEAYAVLSDPEKRAAYDLARRGGAQPFGWSQQDIFADLLRRMAAGGFRDLGPEFTGLRFDEAFLRQVFFSRGPFVVRGFFYSSGFPPGAAAGAARGAAGPTLSGRVGCWLLRQLGRAAIGLVGLGLRRMERRLAEEAALAAEGLELTYRLVLSPQEAAEGTTVEIAYPRGAVVQQVTVKVPALTRHGTTLKLREMGLSRGGLSGDLLVQVSVR